MNQRYGGYEMKKLITQGVKGRYPAPSTASLMGARLNKERRIKRQKDQDFHQARHNATQITIRGFSIVVLPNKSQQQATKRTLHVGGNSCRAHVEVEGHTFGPFSTCE